MKPLRNTLKRLLCLPLITGLIATGSPASAAAPLADRLSSIEQLAGRFRWLKAEQTHLVQAVAAHSICRTNEVRADEALSECFMKADEVVRRARTCRSLILDVLRIASSSEAQPVPDSFATKVQLLKENFRALEQLDERLEYEMQLFAIKHQGPSRPACDQVLQNAQLLPSDMIDLDPKLAICRSIRIATVSRVPKIDFMDVHVSFDEDEGVHMSPGDDPEGPGNEDSACSGRACTGEGSRGGGRAENEEGRHAFNPDRYNHEKMREWAEGKSGGERPVPIDDEQVMKIERDRFESDAGAKTWPVVEAAVPVVTTANAALDAIPKGELYRPEPPKPQEPNTTRIRIGVASNVPDKMSIETRLGLTHLRLKSARPSTSQQEAAKKIAEAAIDDGYDSLANGELAEAEHSTTLAEGMTDLALGLTPGVSWVKDVFEAVTGKNLVTGETLSGFDRSLAIFGAATIGLGSSAGTALKALNRISKIARRLEKLDRAFVAAEKLARTAVRIGVRTKTEAKEFVDFSRRAFGNEIGAVGDGVDRLVKRLGLQNVQQIWTSRFDRTALENATEHFADHGKEFADIKTFDDYVIAAHEFVKNPPVGTLKKAQGTDRIYYHEASNTFAAATNNFVPRTMYKPKELIQLWLSKPGKEIP